MVKSGFLLTVPCLMIIFFCSPLFAEDLCYVQSLSARIMSAPSFQSSVLGEVTKGSRLQTRGRNGNWIKVLYNAKEGYISSLLVSAHPPLEKQALIRGDGTEIREGVRRRASTFASAAAARGLTHDDRRRLNSEEKSDYGSLEQMVAFTVSTQEVLRFMEEGSR
jgi:uncharacterized protein YgiM (DUF1202 family)